MIYKKSKIGISLFITIFITLSLIVGCSSSKPVSGNNVLTTQQQSQDKVDAEKKAKESETAKLEAQLQAEQKSRLEAEEKAKKEAEARALAEAQLKAQQESSQKSTQQQTETKSITVYVTKTGEKYHRSGCRYLSKSKIPMSLESAKLGYSPCSVCNPPR